MAKVKRESEVKVWGTGLPLREFLYVDDFGGSMFVFDGKLF